MTPTDAPPETTDPEQGGKSGEENRSASRNKVPSGDPISEPRHSSPDTPDDPDQADADEPDTFPRAYVVKLRAEAAEARVKAKDRDDLAARLHTALVAATGRLADPTDLPYEEAHLNPDGETLTAAIDELLTRKPHLGNRRPRGDVGQGVTTTPTTVDLAGLLRARA